MPLRTAFLAVVVLVCTWPFAPAAAKSDEEPPIAFAARVVGDANRARLIVDFDREVSADIRLADEPMRLLVDLPRTLFRLPDDLVRPSATLVSRVTHGVAGDERSRLTVELASPAVVAFQTFRPADSQSRHRLIVDLRSDDREEFEARLRRQELAVEAGRAEEPAAPPARDRRARIVIDPGHGGVDGGAKGRRGLLEKRVTLAFARALRDALKAKGHDVLMTREGDAFVSLSKRLEFIRKSRADLAISVHADSLRQRSIRGATVYSLSRKGSDALSRALAQDQNRADLLAGIDAPSDEGAGDILLDLMRRETEGFSYVLAEGMVESLRKATRLIGNPHRSADFFVLKAPETPSVLLELGYLSNVEDEKQLASKAWRERVADALAQGIDSHLKSRGDGEARAGAIVCAKTKC